jgi:hypothetical protein
MLANLQVFYLESVWTSKMTQTPIVDGRCIVRTAIILNSPGLFVKSFDYFVVSIQPKPIGLHDNWSEIIRRFSRDLILGFGLGQRTVVPIKLPLSGGLYFSECPRYQLSAPEISWNWGTLYVCSLSLLAPTDYFQKVGDSYPGQQLFFRWIWYDSAVTYSMAAIRFSR